MDTYAMGTAKVIDIAPDAYTIHRALKYLQKSQHSDGSWGATILEKIVATTQSVMLFEAAGYPIDDPIVSRGIDWLLADPEIVVHEGFYWRIGPMLKIPQLQDYVEHDVAHVEGMIEDHVGPQGQILQLFVMKALMSSGVRKDDLRITRHIRFLTDQWSPSKGWKDSLRATSQALAILAELEFPGKDRVIPLTKQYIITAAKANRISSDMIAWGPFPTYTAYIIMNLLDSVPFRYDQDLFPLYEKGVKWLASQQTKEGYWSQETHPQGLKTVTPDYSTAVIARAILALNTVRDPSFPLQVMRLDIQEIESTVRRAQLLAWSSMSVVALASALILWQNQPWIEAHLAFPWIAKAGPVATFLIGILAAYETIENRVTRIRNRIGKKKG